MINELIGIKYPIICGAMANITDGKFAAEISNAGGLGIIGGGGNNAKWVREQIKIYKSLTDKPFGVNLMLMSPFCDEIAKVIIEENVKYVTTGAGSPNKYIKMFNEVGIRTMPVVGSVAQAIRAERAGAFAIIAEGLESGGHVGEETTMVIVPQVINACNIPVIAAGGIADGKTFNAVLAMGAEGIQVGTLFIASKECNVSDVYKNVIVEARDIDTIIAGRKFQAPVRLYKNNLARRYNEIEEQANDRLELEFLEVKYHMKAVNGDLDEGSFMIGQNSGLVKEIKSVKDIMADLVNDAIEENKKQKEKIKILESLK